MSFTIPNLADAAFPEQAEVDSGDTRIIQQGIRDLGVVSGCGVTAQGTPNMTVAVASGSVRWDTDLVSVTGGNVTIEPADGTNARFDLIQVTSAGVKVNPTAGDGKGIADPEPVFPVHLNFRIVLAVVYVPALNAAIEANQIVDKRMTLVTPKEYPSIDIIDRNLTTIDVTNNPAHTDIYNFTIPAGIMGSTGGFRCTINGEAFKATQVATIVLRIYLEATKVFESEALDFNMAHWRWQWDILCMNKSVAVQKWGTKIVGVAPSLMADNNFAFELPGESTSDTIHGCGFEDSAVNTGSNKVFRATVDWSATSPALSWKKEMAILELIPPA